MHEHTTADEHVRAATDAVLRAHERTLATAFDHPTTDDETRREINRLVDHLMSSVRLRGSVRQVNWLEPPSMGVTFLDLGVLLIIAAALGMVIGGTIVSLGW